MDVQEDNTLCAGIQLMKGSLIQTLDIFTVHRPDAFGQRMPTNYEEIFASQEEVRTEGGTNIKYGTLVLAS